MKQSLMALALAAALMGSLTACTARNNEPGPVGSGGSSVQSPAGSSIHDPLGGDVDGAGSGGAMSGSASGGSVAGSSNDGVVAKGPAGSTYSNGRVNYSRQSTVGQRTNTGNWTASPYLTDGRYRANGNGVVGVPEGNGGRGLTDAARDMVRGTGDALRDVGNGVKNAVRDVTGQ